MVGYSRTNRWSSGFSKGLAGSGRALNLTLFLYCSMRRQVPWSRVLMAKLYWLATMTLAVIMKSSWRPYFSDAVTTPGLTISLRRATLAVSALLSSST